MRSGLWQPDSWGECSQVSFGRELAEKNGLNPTQAVEIDQYCDASYANSAKEEGMIG